MSNTPQPAEAKSVTRRLLESGIIFAGISFVTGLINFAFVGLIGRRLGANEGEFGLANTANSFIELLALPLLMASTAIAHYIAHYRATGDEVRLRGLLLGCRKILFWITIAGSVAAMAMVLPLSRLFNFSRTGLILIALVCALAWLWAYFFAALCQGNAWFKRLAIIGLLGALLRWGYTWLATMDAATAEKAVSATGVALLAHLILLWWWKELFPKGQSVSPWNKELLLYFIVSAACVGGTYCFLRADQLVVQRYFLEGAKDNYMVANRLANALPMVVGPLLLVLFTSRSGERTGNAASAQLKLLGLYALGLIIGGVLLVSLRHFCVRLVCGKEVPEAAALVLRLSVTMVFAGLLQALGMWALASRWLKVALLYGALGLIYWVILLMFGKTTESLLTISPVASGIAFFIVLAMWLVLMRRKPDLESD
jgi:hypothetical protein